MTALPDLARRHGVDLDSPYAEVALAALGWTAVPAPPDRERLPAVERWLDPIEDALAALRAGRPVLVVDDADREDEGDLILAAEHATPESVALLLELTSGVLCVALPGERCDALDLPPMVARSTDPKGTAFTVSVDARVGTSTGISAADRALTIRALADPATRPDDLNRPGHVFPLRARDGGVLVRPGHTEATVDLARMAGLTPAGVLCEVVSADRRGMARLPELRALADRHDLPLVAIADLIRYRRRTERLVRRTATTTLPTLWGDMTAHAYASAVEGVEHLALVVGDPAAPGAVPLVRVHSECLTGDVFGSLRCDCGAQLRSSMSRIADAGAGVLVYLRGQEGRGIGLGPKLAAYALQDRGRDTVDANLDLGLPVDARDYTAAAQILADLGVSAIGLLTNNPVKYGELADAGLDVTRVPLATVPTAHNARYLRTKRDRMGHLPPGEGTP